MSDQSSRAGSSRPTYPSPSFSDLPPTADDNPYDDPANLLRVYPFVTYQPTARTATHIASHAVTHPESVPSSELYPQHAQDFDRLNRPTSQEDRNMRARFEGQVRQMLDQGPSYSSSYLPTAANPADPSSLLPYPSSHPPPLPYSFLPSYLPSPAATLPESPNPDNLSASDFLDNFINATLEKAPRVSSPSPIARSPLQVRQKKVNGHASLASPPPTPDQLPNRKRGSSTFSAGSTPRMTRAMAQTDLTDESPDPLSMVSPSKRQRRSTRSSSREVSPSLRDPHNLHKARRALASDPPTQTGEVSEPPQRVKGSLKVVIPISNGRVIPQLRPQDLDSESPEEREDEDDLDWDAREQEDDDYDWKMDAGSSRGASLPPRSRFVAVSSGGRTGDKDGRNDVQRLMELLEKILDESDGFPPDPRLEDIISARYFSSLGDQDRLPLLSDDSVNRVTRYHSRVRAKQPRARVDAPVENETIDYEVIVRYFRILERSMREAEHLVVFPTDKKIANTTSNGKSARAKKGKPASKSRSPEDGDRSQTPGKDEHISQEEIAGGQRRLQCANSAVVAALCCLAVFSDENMPKPLLSEELITLAIGIIRDQTNDTVLRVVDGMTGAKLSSQFVSYVVSQENDGHKTKAKQAAIFLNDSLSCMAQSCALAIHHIISLVTRSDLTFSDQLVTRAVYLSIGPLFASTSAGIKSKGKSKDRSMPGTVIMKTLRSEGLRCLTASFARYEGQRQWIIEEILNSMANTSDSVSGHPKFKLSDGTVIHMFTSLLLQLIQASAYGISGRIERVRHLSFDVQGIEKKSDASEEESQLCSDATESSLKSIQLVAGYLVQRAGAAKSSKSGHDMDYKTILELFVNDLLSILYRPEWPAASMFLMIISRLMIASMDDSRSTGDSSNAKSLALDHLGEIAGKLKSMQMTMQEDHTPTLDEVVSSSSLDSLETLLASHGTVKIYISMAAREESMMTASLELSNVVQVQEFQNAISKAQSVVEKLAGEKDEEAIATKERLEQVVHRLQKAQRDLWTQEVSPFQANDVNRAVEAGRASIAVARGRSLQQAFGPILAALVEAMRSNLIAHRSKALRGISSIVVVDPTVLTLPNVKEAIEHHLSDPAPSVRDAAVDLVGKYVVQRPDLAAEYYPQLVLRVSDPGLAVRKRVIRLLKGIFDTSDSKIMRVDICCKMTSLISKRDESVKDLATKTLGEMLFPPEPNQHVPVAAARLLVDMIDEYTGPTSTLENAVQEVAKLLRKEAKSPANDTRFADTASSLIQSLIDATETTDFDALNHIRALHLLSTAYSDLVDVGKAEVLLTYLRIPASNPDEQVANEAILNILRRSIPVMPRAASAFATELSGTLLPMINKPSGGFPMLKETIACFCAVTNHLTLDYSPILRVFRACESKIRAMRNEWTSKGTTILSSGPATSIMLYISALIAENCDLDTVSRTNEEVDRELGKICEGLLSDHLFECFLDFSRMPISQTAPSICLGSLFKAYPTLILRDEAVAWQESVFAGSDAESQARLLSVIHDFLVAQGEKKQVEKKTDLEALMGNHDLSEQGLSAAVVQRNFHHIIQGAKSHDKGKQDAAMDILAYTVQKGLYHPLQCMPILVSLETSENEQVADRALDLHQTLHSKHSTLVNVRFLECAQASFEYQRSITAEVSGHRDGAALLSPWYSIISEKRSFKLDFIRQVCRAFDYSLSGSSKLDPGLALYIAENLAVMDYKTQEEVMTVIYLLSGVISGCAHLVSILESGVLAGADDEEISDLMVQVGESEMYAQTEELFPASLVAQASISVGLAIITKTHLLDLYSLPEDKCVKMVLGKKSAIGDKPAIRKREDVVLDCSRMPFARGINNIGEYKSQSSILLQLLHEDGTFTLDDHDM